jgi:hypothetical protein
MEPTIIGIFVTLGGLAVSARSLTAVLSFVLFCSLLGGASIADMGGSSIPPADFALLFLGSRLVISRAFRFSYIATAFWQNVFFTSYCLYSAITAMLLPRIFANHIDIVPMRSLALSIYSVVPLHMSMQNATTAFYILGTLFAAMAASIIVWVERSQAMVIRVIVTVTWLHIFFGVLGALLAAGGHSDWLDFVRNGNYAQLSQSTDGVQRIAGLFPEASAYVAFGFFFFAFNAELWLRNVRSDSSGVAALAMLAILLCSTSSTAYVSIAVYALALLLRFMVTPMHLPVRKMFWLLGLAFVGLFAALVIAVAFHSFGNEILKIVDHATIHKANTLSGRQRLIWAEQGFRAFRVTYGLGIGVGSFRSSSLLSAVLGSTGIIGITLLFGAFLGVLRIFRTHSHDLRGSPTDRVANAAAWGAVMGIIPAFITAPGADPGIIFGIFCGIAVGCRLQQSPIFAARIRFAHRQAIGPSTAVAGGAAR